MACWTLRAPETSPAWHTHQKKSATHYENHSSASWFLLARLPCALKLVLKLSKPAKWFLGIQHKNVTFFFDRQCPWGNCHDKFPHQQWLVHQKWFWCMLQIWFWRNPLSLSSCTARAAVGLMAIAMDLMAKAFAILTNIIVTGAI